MKFIDYINERIKDEKEFDAVIGDVDMPVTLGFCDDWVITDYCKEKYGELFKSEIIILQTDDYVDTIEVLYDNDEIGEQFCWAVAGYIGETEWDKLFMGD